MITKDPDARFKDMIANGDVSFSGISLVESLHGVFPYAAWVAQVAFTYFIGELPQSVVDLQDFLKGFSVMTPSGTLRVHQAFMELSRLINKCKTEKASINYRDTILSIVEGLEKVQEGRFPPFDVLTGYALRLRQPVRQSDTAQPSVLDELLGRIGAYADTEVMNDALRTPGLHPGTQETRHTYAVKEQSASELAPRHTFVVTEAAPATQRHTFVVTEAAPAIDGIGVTEGPQVMAAFARVAPPPCPGCGQPGVQGTSHLQPLPHAHSGRGLREDRVFPARKTPPLWKR